MSIRERWGGPMTITSEEIANRLEVIANSTPYLRKRDEAILQGVAQLFRRQEATWTLRIPGDDED
jgi:hypothetical protein